MCSIVSKLPGGEILTVIYYEDKQNTDSMVSSIDLCLDNKYLFFNITYTIDLNQ